MVISQDPTQPSDGRAKKCPIVGLEEFETVTVTITLKPNPLHLPLTLNP